MAVELRFETVCCDARRAEYRSLFARIYFGRCSQFRKAPYASTSPASVTRFPVILSMHALDTRISSLLAWSHARGIRIDTRLALAASASGPASRDDSPPVAVFARAAIAPGETLVRIPRSAVLSTRVSPLAAHIPRGPAPDGDEARLGLALALHYEL
ncbi:hypothetical protein HWV62_14714 [Athelia sp. TMB]|nr:hypothetical protein HWV62_14714 [Athelia sp. TMB]